MKATYGFFLIACILPVSLFPAASTAGRPVPADYRLAAPDSGHLLRSTGTGVSAKAATDSFYIYGGPGTLEGQFQTEASVGGGAGGQPDPQDWTGHDLTEIPSRWRVGTTNAESVADGNPQGFTGDVGNHAVIAHHEGPDYTGVGNNWDEWLVFRYDPSITDPTFDPNADSTTVRLLCEYKHDTMPGFDYLIFDWERNGEFVTLAEIDDKSYNETTGYYEIRNFDSDGHGGIAYGPNDYRNGSEIVLRLRIHTDGGWSDEDFLWPTEGRGAAAVDNIQVYANGILVSTADWEHLNPKDELPDSGIEGHDNGAAPGTDGWIPTPAEFVGDFSKLFAYFQDLDLCRSNESWNWGFANDGTSPNNCPDCPIDPATSPNWGYGIPGGYVVDYNGGLTQGAKSLANEIWSPPIDWDLPGSEDDLANGGAVLGFTRWTHLPLSNRIFARWKVRSFDGSQWSEWGDNNYVYYSNTAAWENVQIDVTEHLVPDPQQVQIALGVYDMAELYGTTSDDATNSPLYDNVYFKKYIVGGPFIASRTDDLASDCFPVDGTLTGSCRFDANIKTSRYLLAPGDSIVAQIKPVIPGSELVDPLHGGDLVVAHRANPDFAAQRATALAQLGAVQLTTDPQTNWPVFYYHVPGAQVTSRSGEVVQDRYYWDLPDGTSNGLSHIQDEPGLFFPGDVLHYHIQAQDDLGNTSTLPHDLSDFVDFTEGTGYSRIFTVRGLPSLAAGEQPNLLFWNDAGHGDDESDYLDAFREMGEIEGISFDTYTTKAPDSGLANGLGSAGFHGATAEQLSGYQYLVYVLGEHGSYSISDGTGYSGNDLGNDLGTLNAWADADADRCHAYFGDDFVESMVAQGAACQAYLHNVLGVDYLGSDVRPVIDQQTAPVIMPTGLGTEAYMKEFVAYGGCLVINDFDEIDALGIGAVAAHGFSTPWGTQYPTPVAASVEWRRTDGNGNRKHTIVFPFDLGFVYPTFGGGIPGLSARAALLQEIVLSWDRPVVIIDPGTDDPPERFSVAQNYPNPFNPRTIIRFSLPAREQVSVKVYNVRGELVATLQDGVMDAGPQSVSWEGRDSNGREVSSGVYLYTVATDQQSSTRKMALLR